MIVSNSFVWLLSTIEALSHNNGLLSNMLRLGRSVSDMLQKPQGQKKRKAHQLPRLKAKSPTMCLVRWVPSI